MTVHFLAPVGDAVSYKKVKFDEYFTNRSPYTPEKPSKELDQMWEDLYNCEYSMTYPFWLY